MFEIRKTFEVAVAHQLTLPYESPCNRYHGHNLKITVYCQALDKKVLDDSGMVVDFAYIKKLIHGELDHRNLNDVFPAVNPTSERLAWWVCQQIPECYRVDVQESEGNIAIYYDE
jgi:6-pyruvoyltetrahydropterin/6-carboxytetrahydropterin synthase